MAKLQFEPRGQQMNRIEAVSDVVFGFALTLLVVSLQAPRTYSDLVNVMSGFPAFALTFAVLMAVWARHYYFFRYYGLDDPTIIVLNTLLLFIVLFYVYPLKFFVSVFLANVWLRPLIGGPMQIRDVPGGPGTLMVWGDQRGLVMIFGSGFAAIYFVFGAMYWHAYRMREELHLSAFEIAHTMTSIVSQMLNFGVGLLLLLGAYLLQPNQGGHVAYVLFLVPAIWLWRWSRRSRDSV